MSPKRPKKRKHWPANLHATNRKDGRVYFWYLRPDLKKGDPKRFIKFGYVPETDAIDAVRQLNQQLAPGGPLVVQALAQVSQETPEACTVSAYIGHFLKVILPARRINGHPLASSTLEEYKRLYRNIEHKAGERPLISLSQADLAELLADLGTTAEVFNKYRTRLIDLYKHAVSEGKVPENIPAKILPRDKEPKKRKRITLPGERPGEFGIDGIEAYQAIFKKADRATQIAMELCLNAMQRRHELYRWHKDWSRQEKDGRWVYIRINKTHKHGAASYICIPESLPVVHSELGASTLGELIQAAQRDEARFCPYLVSRKPKRIRKAKTRKHPWQLTAGQISRGFAEARDETGLYSHLPDKERPTLHELIALGEHLREKQGWSTAQIQALRGHTSAKMTGIYLEGHEWKKVEYPEKPGKR